MAASRTGSVVSSDPRAAAQAASIGAVIQPDGWWTVNGKRLTPKQADDLVNAKGTGISGLTDNAHGQTRGFLGDLYDRNQSFIDPIATVGAGLVGGPAAAAAASAALKYGKQHDVGDALKSGVTSYGVGKLLPMIGKLPGASSVQGALAKIPGAGAVTDLAGKVGNITIPGLGGVSDAAKGLGSKLPSLGQVGDFVTGNNGLNALGIGQGINTALLQKHAMDLGNRAESLSMDEWNKGAALRDAGRAGIANPVQKTLPALGTIRQTNPFARGA